MLYSRNKRKFLRKFPNTSNLYCSVKKLKKFLIKKKFLRKSFVGSKIMCTFAAEIFNILEVMMLEHVHNHGKSRFVQLDDTAYDEPMYIRQIKDCGFFSSSWKTVVKKGTKTAITFTEQEVKNSWVGSAMEFVPIDDGSTEWKWLEYDLI